MVGVKRKAVYEPQAAPWIPPLYIEGKKHRTFDQMGLERCELWRRRNDLPFIE
jgi:hypothetical protein